VTLAGNGAHIMSFRELIRALPVTRGPNTALTRWWYRAGTG